MNGGRGADELWNIIIPSDPMSGASLFSVQLCISTRPLYGSGIGTSGDIHVATEAKTPVIDGERPASRYRIEQIMERVPPAELSMSN
jgi:hypothetical protein